MPLDPRPGRELRLARLGRIRAMMSESAAILLRRRGKRPWGSAAENRTVAGPRVRETNGGECPTKHVHRPPPPPGAPQMGKSRGRKEGGKKLKRKDKQNRKDEKNQCVCSDTWQCLAASYDWHPWGGGGNRTIKLLNSDKNNRFTF